MHKEIYLVGQKLPKREKLGVHAEIERYSVELLILAVTASFQSPTLKQPVLETLRIKIETLKHLIRSEQELGIIKEGVYLRLSEQLIEISKQTNWWLAFLTQKGA